MKAVYAKYKNVWLRLSAVLRFNLNFKQIREVELIKKMVRKRYMPTTVKCKANQFWTLENNNNN